jgi:hypothetical protein
VAHTRPRLAWCPVFRKPASTLVAAVVAAAVAFAPAQADPFFDDMTLQSHAYGLEMVAVRLALVEAFDPIPEELEEQVEKLFGRDVHRFLGTLRARDAAVAEGLVAALEVVEEGAESGSVSAADLATARDWWTQAYDVLVPDDRRTPAFWGAVIADLLLADDGVAEALEDALAEEEYWEYPGGWAALQRVEALWAELEPLADEEQRSFARQYLDILGEIYAGPDLPDVFPANPEEAEAPAQSLVGIVEATVGASLYTGRDLARLASHLADVVAPACELYAAGEDEVAIEAMYTARNHYRKHLRRLLDLVAPDIHAVAGDMLDAFVSRNDLTPPDDRGAGCQELREALEEAATALGG